VAAGANSAIPHHRPTGAVLAAGDFVKIDFGALVGGYHSDMTRTFILGSASDWQLELYALVAEAQRAGRAALRAGASLRDVDGAARQVIVDAGYGENFGHGLGHGVGLQIHEAPGISASAAGTLLAGSAVTVEPGVYLPERGGVRIEDTLVVASQTPETAGPTPELLTRFPKELTIV
jgi:Xaa-Pro aminopeptidase